MSVVSPLMILAQVEPSQQEQVVTFICLIGAGLLLIGISIPLLYGKIGPNWFYGFKTRKTVYNREIWYKANKYMAKDFIRLGSLIVIYGLVFLILSILRIGISIIIPVSSLVVFVGGSVIVLVRGLLYLKKL